MSRCMIWSTALLVVAWEPGATRAALPSVAFADLARSANCIALAEPIKPFSNSEYQFRPLAIISGCDSSDAMLIVRRSSSESRGEFARMPYVLFLQRLGDGHYAYSREPFGALSVMDGSVSTYAFGELPTRMPLEQLIKLIKDERRDEK